MKEDNVEKAKLRERIKGGLPEHLKALCNRAEKIGIDLLGLLEPEKDS
jgi:hypothetical protein